MTLEQMAALAYRQMKYELKKKIKIEMKTFFNVANFLVGSSCKSHCSLSSVYVYYNVPSLIHSGAKSQCEWPITEISITERKNTKLYFQYLSIFKKNLRYYDQSDNHECIKY